MFKSFYTIDERYKDKKIWIWDINADSLDVFHESAFAGANVSGFITNEKQYIGESIMNRPVVYSDSVADDDIVVAFTSPDMEDKHFFQNLTIKTINEIFVINPEIKEHQIYIYGAGNTALSLRKDLEKQGIDIKGFCVSDLSKAADNGTRICDVHEILYSNEIALILATEIELYRYEMLDLLQKNGAKCDTYIKGIISRQYRFPISFFRLLDRAIRRKRKVFLYAEDSDSTSLIKDIFFKYGVSIEKCFSNKAHDEEIYDLALINSDDAFVVINDFNIDQLYKRIEIVESLGFKADDNYVCVQAGIFQKDYIKSTPGLMAKDMLIQTGSVDYTRYGGMPGWYVHGSIADREDNASLKIMVLGGSCSTEKCFRFETWASKLHVKLSQSGIKNVIYNGASYANTVTVELLRFLRDAYVIKPDVVISMSGSVNMITSGCKNHFNDESLGFRKGMVVGLDSDESTYDFWVRIERLLNKLASDMGARCFSILQPVSIYMDEMSLEEKLQFEKSIQSKLAKKFLGRVNDGEGYINLVNLLDHKENAYIDFTHYTEHGQELIANKIFDILYDHLLDRTNQ